MLYFYGGSQGLSGSRGLNRLHVVVFFSSLVSCLFVENSLEFGYSLIFRKNSRMVWNVQ